jgi:hypothetical protein
VRFPFAKEKFPMAIKTITRMFRALCTCAALVTISAAVAQSPKVYRPGDRVAYRVTFEGANAGKLNSVKLHFSLITPAIDEQVEPPFLLNLWLTGSTLKMVSTALYEVTLTIPAYAPDGTFSLDMVEVTSGPFTHIYSTELPAITLVVGHTARPPEWPKLKGVEPGLEQP